jgi:DNA processing protein
MKSDLGKNFSLFCLGRIKGLGVARVWSLLKEFKNPENILQLAELSHSPLNKKIAKLISDSLTDKRWLADAQKDFAQLTEDYLTILEEDYPPLLKNIYDPPLFLFYRGQRKLLLSPYLLTMVGSRTVTNYHQTTTEKLIKDLTTTPLVIVSGLAIGLDALCHQTALANNLTTIAVLGSGLDKEVLYPQSNLKLAEKIVTSGGLLLSEYPAKDKPQLHYFPKRNRILAGLSKATVIISGALKSGTLITAQVALEEGREIFALPGNINLTLSQGPNSLIANGANILLTAEQILSVYDLIIAKTLVEKIKFTNDLQKQIYQLLQTEPLGPTELAKKLKTTPVELNIHLTQLEIQGLIRINLFNQAEII